MTRDSTIFYRSFYESLKDLNDSDRLIMYDAIFQYSLDEVEPELTGLHQALFTLIKPQVDANMKRYENGKKGGRPRNQEPTVPEPTNNQSFTNEAPNENQTETEVKPNNNQTITTPEPNKNYNVNVNDNVNYNLNENKNVSLSKVREITSEEREKFFEVLFFEKKVFAPAEYERFTNHYAQTGWKNKSGNQIIDRVAALKNWAVDSTAIMVPSEFGAIWFKLYKILKEKLPNSDYSLLLSKLHRVEITEKAICLHCEIALYNFFERSEFSQHIIGELKKLMNGKSLKYTEVKPIKSV